MTLEMTCLLAWFDLKLLKSDQSYENKPFLLMLNKYCFVLELSVTVPAPWLDVLSLLTTHLTVFTLKMAKLAFVRGFLFFPWTGQYHSHNSLELSVLLVSKFLLLQTRR